MNAAAKPLLWGLAAGVAVIGAVWAGRRAAGAAGAAIGGAVQAVNPFNPENVFYRGANATGAAVTGEPAWNVGADLLFPLFNPTARALERDALAPTTPGFFDLRAVPVPDVSPELRAMVEGRGATGAW